MLWPPQVLSARQQPPAGGGQNSCVLPAGWSPLPPLGRLLMSVHVLVFPRLKASKNLWYVSNGAPGDQCSLLPWAGPHCFRWRPFLVLWAVGPGSLSVPAGSGVRVTALQSGRFSPGALQPSITAALECPGSRAPEGLLQAVLARGASPVVPTGCLPAAGMRCVHGLLLRNPASLCPC